MGEILARLTSDQLKACQLSLKLMDDKAMELGLIKRGHQHLWNELSARHGVAGRKIEIDYTTGLIMERAEVEKPKEEQLDV